jgi:Zinc finger, C2H2 type
MCFNNVQLVLSLKDRFSLHRNSASFWPSILGVENIHWYQSFHHARRTVMNDPVRCEYCGRTFGTEEDLEAHESDHLLSPEHRSWECDQCRRTFYQSLALEQHLHDKHSSCRFCDKRTVIQSPVSVTVEQSMEQAMEQPLARSMEEDKYCGNCDRSFPTLLDFMQHDQAVHISCQFCDTIGSRKDRKVFDYHCCGCNEILSNDDDLDKHLRTHPQHHHGHPLFISKAQMANLTSSPRLGAQRVPRAASTPAAPQMSSSGSACLSPPRPAGIEFTRTPATPIDEMALRSSRPLLRKRRRSNRAPSRVQKRSVPDCPRFLCDDCRIVFPDGPTLTRHQSFSFLRSVGCQTRFSCPFSLLRHIEAGTCCHWKSPDQG